MESAGGSHYRPFPSFMEWVPDLDLHAVDAYVNLLEESKGLATAEQLEAAVMTATRYAAVDTGAIEGLYTTSRGFTKTIATQSAAWEAALAQHGEDVKRSIEDQLAAYEMVLDAATRNVHVSESWIRQLHEVVCRSQDAYEVWTELGWQAQPLPKGIYKSMPNNPTSSETGRIHHYAPPSDTPAEMARLTAELRSPAFIEAHSVLQSAYSHYAFVCVHPFADGNGRVARALASIFLYRNPGVPLVVFADQKDQYIDCLESADSGNSEPFARFVGERVMDTTEMVRISLGAPTRERLSDALRELAEGTGRAGLPFAEYDAARERLSALAQAAFEQAVAELDLPSSVTVSVGSARGSVGPPPPAGYRGPGDAWTTLTFSALPPGDAQRSVEVRTWAAKSGAADVSDFLLVADADSTSLEIPLRDIHPVASHVLDIKLDTWSRAVVVGNLERLAAASRRRRIELGYSQD